MFGTIPTTIPDTTPVITPPATQTDTSVIPTETPTIPPSPDYTPASPDYSHASDLESDPSEDPSSDHIPPLPATSPFLSSDDDPTDSDTPDTPSSPTHDTPFIEITASTQRSPIIPRHRVMLLASGQPIPYGRPSPMTSVPALSPISGALSPVPADLIPSPKRVRDSGYSTDVELRLIDRDETETGVRGPVEVRVERVTHPVDARGYSLRPCSGRRHVAAIEGVQREQGHRIIGVESAVIALTERLAELERDNMRLRGTASVESQRVDRLQRAEEMEAREAARTLEPLNENVDELEGENRGNGNGGNRGNGNRGNGGNRNGNHGTEGVVGLTRWFEKIETVFNISNCPSKYQVKYATCTLQDSALTWNEIQKMETELWNLAVKGDLTAYTQSQYSRMLYHANHDGTRSKGYAAGCAVDKRRDGSNLRDKPVDRTVCFRDKLLVGTECGRALYGWGTMKDCPKMRNQNRGNQTRNKNGNKTGNQTRNQTGGNEITARAYAIGGGGTNPDSNVVTGTFLLKNCYASMLFDSGADRSFVSTTFSALLDVTPTTLETSYAVLELARGRIQKQIYCS
ncbi:hypothetical protein Tco_1466717 [Tanacetum coccineum]